MRSIEEIRECLTNPGIIAVVRARDSSQVVPLTGALLDAELIAVEITMTTPNALSAIREVRDHFGSKVLLGVGTVLDSETAKKAMDAGAEFVVSPIANTALIEAAHLGGCPVMLGAYTPTEAQTAHELGADFIKIFPADKLGPQYIRAIRAPLPHLRIIPTGGIDLNNALDFFKAGCVALGLGSSLVSAEILRDADWAKLTELARSYVAIARSRA